MIVLITNQGKQLSVANSYLIALSYLIANHYGSTKRSLKDQSPKAGLEM